MSRKVNQQTIAEALGIDRSTVSKILNRDPKYSASIETREKVFKEAELLGYDFHSIRRPFKREHTRQPVDILVDITIQLANGDIMQSGTALAHNLSVGGALLWDIKLNQQVLPLESFTFNLKFTTPPSLNNLEVNAELVRITGLTLPKNIEIGVRFLELSSNAKKSIQNFLSESKH